VGVPVLESALSDDPPQLTQPCIEIASGYAEGLKASPELRELIVPGADGESIVVADPEAQLCGIRAEALERIATQSTAHDR
jgi:hypothetical protein